MALTPIEAKEVYDELSKIAMSAGLEWLVKDVSAEISLGVQHLQKIKTETTAYSEENRYSPIRKGKPATFVVIKEFSDNDKLRLLVEAIEAASSGLTLAVERMFHCFSSAPTHAISEIAFAPDIEKGKILSIEKHILTKLDAARQLDSLLRELKEEI